MGLLGLLPGGCLLLLLLPASEAILFPRDSPSRESKSLDGLWNFKTSPKVENIVLFKPEAILFSRDSPFRESKSLDGLWNFKTSPKVKILRFFRFSVFF
jgi:hypothetical protein